jgi:hypothetical protein
MMQTYTSQSESEDDNGSRIPVKRVIEILIVLGLIALIAWGAYEAWRRSSAKSEGGDGTTGSTAAGGGDNTSLSTGGDGTTGSTAGGTTEGTTAGTSAPSSGLSTGAIVGIVIGLLLLSLAVVLLMRMRPKGKLDLKELNRGLKIAMEHKPRAKQVIEAINKEGDDFNEDLVKNMFPLLWQTDKYSVFTHLRQVKDKTTDTDKKQKLGDVEVYLGKDLGLKKASEEEKKTDIERIEKSIAGNPDQSLGTVDSYTHALVIERLLDEVHTSTENLSDDQRLEREFKITYLENLKTNADALKFLGTKYKKELEKYQDTPGRARGNM